jgi:hypothetical protein
MVDDNSDRLATRDELRAIIKDATGIEFSRGTLDQLCSPSRNEGPRVAGWLGRRPLYSVSEGIAWARARLRPVRYRVHPVAEAEAPAVDKRLL